jgi:hypothetical protein
MALSYGSDLQDHIPSNDYLKEIPIKHARFYYQRILNQLALARSHQKQLTEPKNKKDNFKYI